MSDRNGASGNGEKNDYEVDDTENKSQNATLSRIQKFRDELAEYQLLFAQNELTQEISQEQQHRSYQRLASGFLQLLKPYLTDDKLKNSTYYWEGYSGETPQESEDVLLLGEFSIDPPEAINQPSQDSLDQAIKMGDIQTLQRADPRNEVEPREYTVIGLRDFAAAEVEWEEEWQIMFGPEVSRADLASEIRDPSVRVLQRSHRNEPLTVVKRAHLPKSVIDNAITAMENFIRDVGMDVQIDEGTPTIQGFDQSREQTDTTLTRTSGQDDDPRL